MNTLWIFRNGKRKLFLEIHLLVMGWWVISVFGLKPYLKFPLWCPGVPSPRMQRGWKSFSR